MSVFVGRIQKAIATLVDAGAWWLGAPNVARFHQAVGLMFDSALEGLMQGLLLSQPLGCDSSALPVLSFDRTLRFYPSESDESKRYRLSQWWQLHRQAGTHQGEMRNLQPYFLPGPLPRIRIVHQAGDGSSATWHTLEPDGTYSVYRAIPSNWNFDGVPSKWSRFWVIVYTTGLIPEAQPEWDGGQLWDGGSVWDGLFNEEQIAAMVALVSGVEIKAAHSILWGFILATDPDSFDPASTAVVNADGSTTLPVGNWGYVINNITGAPTRLPSASFAYDLGQG